MISAKRRFKAVAGLAATLISAGAWALPDPVVTVTYTSGTQAVPFSPAALALLALLIGVFALSKLRAKSGSALVLPLVAGLIAVACVGYVAQTNAMVMVTTVNLLSGNPASQQGPVGLFSILNNTSLPATITNVTVSSPFTVTTACTGQTILPTNSCTVTVSNNPG